MNPRFRVDLFPRKSALKGEEKGEKPPLPFWEGSGEGIPEGSPTNTGPLNAYASPFLIQA